MKYVMLQSEDGRKIPVIFSKFMIHADVVKYFQHFLRKKHKMECKAVSAGEATTEVLECFGKSETLGLASDPSDEKTINIYDYAHGLDLGPVGDRIQSVIEEARKRGIVK